MVSSGNISLNNQITVVPRGITSLILDGFDGDDEFDVATNHPFADVTLDGGNPSGSDVAFLTGGGAALALLQRRLFF